MEKCFGIVVVFERLDECTWQLHLHDQPLLDSSLWCGSHSCERDLRCMLAILWQCTKSGACLLSDVTYQPAKHLDKQVVVVPKSQVRVIEIARVVIQMVLVRKPEDSIPESQSQSGAPSAVLGT